MAAYYSAKGELEISATTYPHLRNARNKLALRLENGADPGQNSAETLAELDAELARRNEEYSAAGVVDDDDVTF